MMAVRSRPLARLVRAWQSITDAMTRQPQACGVEALERRAYLSAASISFKLAQHTLVESSMLATADFNLDGHPDLVTVGPAQEFIHVYLNDGTGLLVRDIGFHIDNAKWVTAADFNGDGNPDIAVVSADDRKKNFIDLFYGRGDGTFFGPLHYSSNVGAKTVTAADVNNDGMLDLVLSNRNRVSVMMNLGQQLFSPAVFYQAGEDVARNLSVGDFNGDGAPDLAVVRQDDRVQILLNQTDANGLATGTFGPPTPYAVGVHPEYSVTGDFNGDGKIDLAVVNSDFRVAPVSVLLGNGDGTFQPRRNYFGGNFVDALTTGDFDGDGKIDLATTSFSSAMRVYPGNGDGTFGPLSAVEQGNQGIFLATADFNGDGLPDIALAGGGGFRILLNRSNTTPTPPGTPGVLDASIGTNAVKSVKFVNSHGYLTTVGLTGPGSAVVQLTGDDLVQNGSTITGQNISIDSINTGGTTTASTLSVTTDNKSGVVDVNSIIVDGDLKSLSGSPILLHGNCTIDGSVASVSLDTLTDGTLSIDQHLLPQPLLGQVNSGLAKLAVSAIPTATINIVRADGMSLASGEVIKAINVGQWISTDGTPSSLSAPVVGTIRSSGPFSASISILSGGLNSFFAPQITGGTWNIAGDVGSISAGSIVNASITIDGNIQSIGVVRKPLVSTYINSTFSGKTIGTANLGTIPFDNGGVPFGITSNSIALVSGRDITTRKAFAIRNPTSAAGVTADLAALGIAARDFVVQIA